MWVQKESYWDFNLDSSSCDPDIPFGAFHQLFIPAPAAIDFGHDFTMASLA